MKNAALIFFTVLLAACGGKTEHKTISPAKVDNPVKESELTKLTLTPEAVKRLGIQTAMAEIRPVNRTQLFSGEVIGIPGNAVTITAPIAGTIVEPQGRKFPAAGSYVRKGQELYRLVILPSERDLLSAKDDAAQKRVQLQVSQQKLERATELYKEGAGSLKVKQEAEAELAANSAALRVAESRVALLSGQGGRMAERLSTLHVYASISGTVQAIYSTPSQIVPTAAPVLDILSNNEVWIRVPVYTGDSRLVNNRSNALIRSLSDFEKTIGNTLARPVQGPRLADAQTSSVYLYYAVNNAGNAYLPGQRVSVTLPLHDLQSSLVIPFSAILYDINGGTWVYENTAPNIFVRRRVEVETVQDKLAIIKRGITAGIKVVTVGTAELFGTEFGGK